MQPLRGFMLTRVTLSSNLTCQTAQPKKLDVDAVLELEVDEGGYFGGHEFYYELHGDDEDSEFYHPG